MKKNLLIAIVVILTAVLLTEIGYIAHKSVSKTQQGSVENTTIAPPETSGETGTTQTTAAGTGIGLPPVTLPGTETERIEPTKATDPTEGTKPAETTKPTESTKPAATTKPTEPTKPAETTKPTQSTKPAETTKPTETEPEETTEETRDSGLGENDLPPQPL